ncbi:thioredoxin family protein [Lederbergia citrea]|uniref:thioredoxin family protein n=1 Tax=Lederbergia citrea TaxID=2833581 RepID=UPI001BC9ABAB|nr:thioredoxin family protein [Lederbergia citrea]MBS4205219.1 thioredoxin family protein [Lederbergia citrea]
MNDWSKEDIMAIFDNKKSAVLYFYTPLCGTCQVAGRMMDVVEQLIRDISFGKTDLNYMPEIAEQFSIESVPCLLVVKEGHISEKIYAFKSVPYLYDLIKRYI